MTQLHVVWFRRDLRLHDHAPLLAAVASGAPIVPLYIFEPDYWALAETSERQFDFLVECLSDLDAALARRGARLTVRVGKADEVLAALHRAHGLAAIHMHADAGLPGLEARDRRVARWALSAGVSLRVQSRTGLGGDLTDETFAAVWRARMAAPRLKAPEHIRDAGLATDPYPLASDFGLKGPACPARQTGGRVAAAALLRSFLETRGRRYRQEMASPVTAPDACSRLSPHLAFGTISPREAWQAAQRGAAARMEDGDVGFAASLEAFSARLEWRDRCLTQAASAPLLARAPAEAAYDGLRPIAAPDDPRLTAWIEGRTGFPFVDACMRALRATGWLNFRMRAMLIGFAAHHLWIDWRRPAEQLAALFTDFEPAIHYAQSASQAATRGAGLARVFNPVKQSLDQDGDGVFIREWVPELGGLSAPHIHAPWDAPKADLMRAGIVLGQTYPMRMVDHVAAAREARERLYAPAHAEPRRRATAVPAYRPVRQAVLARTPPARPQAQLSLDLGLGFGAATAH